MNIAEFTGLRYGMFVHFGLFSLLGRGEWWRNRENISHEDMLKTASMFNPAKFNADEICKLAVAGGMKYIVLTTMHHDGFRLYDTKLSDFNSFKYCGRDLVAETVAAARKHGLKIGLYHSLNNWHDAPDAVAALENKADYGKFIENTFKRLAELVEKFKPIDVLWYDGWWPFNHEGWQAERMNKEMLKIQPGLLFNGRNGLPGDFGTPEQHLTAPSPWRPWEACVTLNDHWGFHVGDNNWKSEIDIVRMLLTCANGKGNLLLNIGPRGDGSIPEESVRIIKNVGKWISEGGMGALTNTELFKFGCMLRQPEDRGDWNDNGMFSVTGNTLHFTLIYNPGKKLTFSGLEQKIISISEKECGKLKFTQDENKVTVELPEKLSGRFCPVLNILCDAPPSIYRTGGMRKPEVTHPRYDPCPPDIQY